MKKSNYITMILGTIGDIFAAIGMCMCLVMIWSNVVLGIIVGIAGIILPLSLIPLIKGLK